MITIVSLHFIASVVLIIFVIYNRISKNLNVISDQALIAIVASLMVNFLGTVGIIFKYLFSKTSETYTHIEMMSKNIDIDD
ncbi:hypothetical protein B7935_10305 [Streptococcus agalactiae]|nr:hypothetical protein B7936_09675 [Streptococcus agalactiae]OTG44815.1 hypothetical protein B7935_10305 [Streptococcus agalactiae]RRA84731.1 hypothetical protein D5F91_07545 [Streptococcus agalactiae]